MLKTERNTNMSESVNWHWFSKWLRDERFNCANKSVFFFGRSFALCLDYLGLSATERISIEVKWRKRRGKNWNKKYNNSSACQLYADFILCYFWGVSIETTPISITFPRWTVRERTKRIEIQTTNRQQTNTNCWFFFYIIITQDTQRWWRWKSIMRGGGRKKRINNK